MPVHAISNVAVFDGRELGTPTNVLFHANPGDVVTLEAASAFANVDKVVDGRGCSLLPALIDANIDTAVIDKDLATFAAYGVATVLDMSSSTAAIRAMRAESAAGIGLPLFLASGPIATAHGSSGGLHERIEESNESILHAADAERFVAGCISGPGKSDYIKVLVDLPGFDTTTLAAIVRAAHEHGKLALAHAVQTTGYSRALDAGFDIMLLVPIDGLLDNEVALGLAAQDIACIPTLCMARALASLPIRGASGDVLDADFSFALANVKTLYNAGVRICAGTEANQSSIAPISIGSSIHEELELLVQAGLSNLDALRAATVVPAELFGLTNRGVISPGLKADMVLVEGDPLDDITCTRKIRKTWIAGIESDGLADAQA